MIKIGKVYKNQICEVCKNKGDVIETWGKRYCKICYGNKPKKGNGHGGMIKDKNISQRLMQVSLSNSLRLQRVGKGDKIFSTLFLEHYPGSKGIMGRQINYLIWNGSKIVGIIGANSPPLNYKKFREYFGVDDEKLFLNNNVFRIIKSKKNQATKILKMFRNTVRRDYYMKYGNKLVGLITFVEPPRGGGIYKADNWDYLGMTQGKKVTLRKEDRESWHNKGWSDGTKKHIYALKFREKGAVII